MTLILEFKHKLIFHKPGILRYAMRQAGRQPGAPHSRAQRHQFLSDSFKRGWAEAKAELAAFQRLQALVPGHDERSRQAEPQFAGGFGHNEKPIHGDVREAGSPDDAWPTVLARVQLH